MRRRPPGSGQDEAARPDPPAGHVCLGIFGAPHGLKGELRLKSHTADPMAIASYGPLVTSKGGVVEFLAVRPAKAVLIARIKGVVDRAAAEPLAHQELFLARERLGETGADEFFHADLIGLEARTLDGASYGTVTALFDFGAGDILEIEPRGGGKALLVPFTKSVIPVVEVARGYLVVVPPPEREGKDGAHETRR